MKKPLDVLRLYPGHGYVLRVAGLARGVRVERRRKASVLAVDRDFRFIEGELVLVLDDAECAFTQGEVALLKGVRYAWSNRSSARAVVGICTHAGRA